MNILKWLFIAGEWRVAIRKRKDKGFYADSFITIPNTKKYWFADPLLFEDGEETYLFVEAFNRRTYKGDIGFFRISDGEASDFELLIDNNFHMSYPLVFMNDGRYYMIPESEENSTVDIYVAENFPRGWKKEKTLLSGVHYADTTLLEIENRKFLFTYNAGAGAWKLLIFELFMDSLEVKLFQTIEYRDNVCRPAGKFFVDEKGRCVRPVQDCRGGYGKGVMLYEILFKDGNFTENKVCEYDNKELVIDGKSGADNFHTYSRTPEYEVIDYIYTKFDLFKEFKWQIRKYKRYKRVKRRQY
jgi:hypothetical protein